MDENQTLPQSSPQPQVPQFPQENKDQLATQDRLLDEATGKPVVGTFVILKDIMGDNHHFQDWSSVAKWAQAKADAANADKA